MKRMKELRLDRGLTQNDVAKVLHCSQVTYSYYEIGRRNIPVGVLVALAEYYGVSADYIVGLTNRKKGGAS